MNDQYDIGMAFERPALLISSDLNIFFVDQINSINPTQSQSGVSLARVPTAARRGFVPPNMNFVRPIQNFFCVFINNSQADFILLIRISIREQNLMSLFFQVRHIAVNSFLFFFGQFGHRTNNVDFLSLHCSSFV